MAGERILIIDDSKEITNFLLAVLQPMGYEVAYTENGKDGLAKVLYDKPDLVLLDLNLPGMSGISILEALYQRKVETPIIMMTFHGAESVVARALRLGARDFIVKPFELDDMLAAIERVLAEEATFQARTRQLDVPREAPAAPVATVPAAPASPKLAASPPPRKKGMVPAFEELMRFLSRSPSQAEFLSRVTEVALRVTGAEASAVFLANSAGNVLQQGVARYHQTQRADLSIRDGYAEKVLNAGQAVQVKAPITEQNFVTYLEHTPQVLMYVPLRLRNRHVGVMGVAYVQHVPPTLSEQQVWLSVLANYVAVILENARFHETLRKAIPLQKFIDVVNLFVRYMANPLQVLWQTASQGEAGALTREVKRVAILLSVFRDMTTPQSGLYITASSVADIEREIQRRIASVENGKG